MQVCAHYFFMLMCAYFTPVAEDYKNEQTLGHQVQNYIPKTIKGSHVKLPGKGYKKRKFPGQM